MKLLITEAASKTGALLETYLLDRGLEVNGKGPVVCYGRTPGPTKAPILNAACSTNKMERLKLMAKANVPTIKWFPANNIPPVQEIKFPLYARKSIGCGAKDLMPVFQIEEIPWRILSGWDWFSEVITIANEYRVWTWCLPNQPYEILGVYKKVMSRPAEYTKMGRNFGQGFEFNNAGLNQDPIMLMYAAKATEAIGLNFAAIDLIVGIDGRIYILEANTAPGVIRSGAQATLAALADKIKGWHNSIA